MGIRRSTRTAERATTYKLCSLALQYPDEELLAARDELAATAARCRTRAARELRRFFAWWTQAPPLEAAQHYVETFDLHKRSGLYLTFFALGDRRDRGMALVRLKKLYRAAGLPLESRELPDYLPIMLEFAAVAPSEYGETLLREHRPALELVRLSLGEQSSPYAHVLNAVCQTLGDLSPVERARMGTLAANGPPAELVGLEPFAPPEVMPSPQPER